MFSTIKLIVVRDGESAEDMVEALLILPKTKTKILLGTMEADSDVQELMKFEKTYRNLENTEGFNFTFDKNYGILRQDFLPKQEKNPFDLSTNITESVTSGSHFC